MTNAEKYTKVFGFPPDKSNCPTEWCGACPLNPCRDEEYNRVSNWWDEEYKEVVDNGKEETT